MVQFPALVIADHSIQQHPLRAVQLLGRHGYFDVIIQYCTIWTRKDSAKHSKHNTDSNIWLTSTRGDMFTFLWCYDLGHI